MQLFEIGMRLEVSLQLFFCELIKRHVLVECMDHVISEGPNGIGLISMVTNGVCIAHQIQPMDRKFFPEGWIGREAIDHLRVICRILRFRELTCCWDRGWKSDEIWCIRRARVALFAGLKGRMPRDSRSAKMKKSIGLVGQSISLTDGKGGLVMGLNGQSGFPMELLQLPTFGWLPFLSG